MCGLETVKLVILPIPTPIIHSLTQMYELRHYNHVRTNRAVLRANMAIWDSLIYIAIGQLCKYNYTAPQSTDFHIFPHHLLCTNSTPIRHTQTEQHHSFCSQLYSFFSSLESTGHTSVHSRRPPPPVPALSILVPLNSLSPHAAPRHKPVSSATPPIRLCKKEL